MLVLWQGHESDPPWRDLQRKICVMQTYDLIVRAFEAFRYQMYGCGEIQFSLVYELLRLN